MQERHELLDYEIFFGVEPNWVHDAGWYYGMRFSVSIGDDRLDAMLAPDEGEFGINVWTSGELKFGMQTVKANGWKIENNMGEEFLVVYYNDENVKFCKLRIRPSLQILWSMGW